MKLETLAIALTLLTFSASSVVATYHGELEKQGPEAEFVVGFASDKKTEVHISVGEKKGLNYTYPEKLQFKPSEAEKRIRNSEGYIPLNEFSISVQSHDPVMKAYKIPVTMKAYSKSNRSGGTAPEVVNERSYTFTYQTQLSPDYGFEESLIDGGDRNQTDLNESTEYTTESTIIEKQQTDSRVEDEKEKSNSGVSPVLVIGVLLVFSYTIYEAIK